MYDVYAVFALTIGAILFFLGWVGKREESPFALRQYQQRLSLRVQQRLRRAGFTETSPRLAITIILGVLGLAMVTLAVVTGSLIAPFFVAPLILVGAWVYLGWRERSFMTRVSNELIPFLRKIHSNVVSGRSVQGAFLEALKESKMINQALEASVVELQLNRPFIEVLHDSQERLPLRAWSQFVRQLELHYETGGDLGEVLTDTIEQIQVMMQLQSEMRAAYGKIAKQQNVLVFIGLGTIPIMQLLMPGAMGTLIGTSAGLIVLAIAAVCMVAGILIGLVMVRDIEAKLDF